MLVPARDGDLTGGAVGLGDQAPEGGLVFGSSARDLTADADGVSVLDGELAGTRLVAAVRPLLLARSAEVVVNEGQRRGLDGLGTIWGYALELELEECAC